VKKLKDSKKKLNVVIAIDDLHPEKGWGVEGDESVNKLISLNEEFGCKFVLFIPSNYHRNFPISEHKDWIDFWSRKEWIELAAHGHFHDRPFYFRHSSECEFYDLDYKEAQHRIDLCLNEWDKVGLRPKGWRMCGWDATQGSFDVVQENFEYIAGHEKSNSNIFFRNHKIFGHNTDIQSENLKLFNDFEDFVYFQSHINGKSNKNTWSDENYLKFKKTLKSILNQRKVNFVTYNEIISRKLLYSRELCETDLTWVNDSTQDQDDINSWLESRVKNSTKVLHIGTGNSSVATMFSKKIKLIDSVTVVKPEKRNADDLKLQNYQIFILDKYSDSLGNLPNRYNYILDNNITSYAESLEDVVKVFENYFYLLEKDGSIISHIKGLSYQYSGSNSRVNCLKSLKKLIKNLGAQLTLEGDIIKIKKTFE
tara:strand:- start:8577 stop:9848 length:1272 start_codon:yes stop_codon:yes gene_type:complete